MAQPSNLPSWNTGGANRATPTTGKQILGWVVGDNVDSSFFNWWMNLVYLWIVYLQNITSEALTWTGLATFNTSVYVNGINNVAPALVVTGYLGQAAVQAQGNGSSAIVGTGNNYAAIQGSGTGAGVMGAEFSGGIGGLSSGGRGVRGIGGSGIASGLANGVFGQAGVGSSAAGVYGSGDGGGAGVYGIGGGSNAAGVQGLGQGGIGNGTGAGVRGTGGISSAGNGSPGVYGLGGNDGGGSGYVGPGVWGQGASIGSSGASGVFGKGGANAAGGEFIAGTGNGYGVVATGGTTGGAGGSFRATSGTTDVALDVRGAVSFANATAPAVNASLANTFHIEAFPKISVLIACNGTIGPGFTGYGVNAPSQVLSTPGTVTVNFARAMSAVNYRAKVTWVAGSGSGTTNPVMPKITAKNTNSLTFEALDFTGTSQSAATMSGASYIVEVWGLTT